MPDRARPDKDDMCFPKSKKLPPPNEAPEKPPEPEEVGASRKAEDQALFGGVPDLRTDQSALGGGAGAGGAGLNAGTSQRMM